jgi:TP901 family phage tail tape measure protein
MNKALEIAVVLTAVDKMTQVINNAVGASSAKLKAFQDQYKNQFDVGKGLIAGGTSLAMSLAPAIQAYADLEDSSTRLKTVMMADGAVLSKNFEAVNNIAIELGNRMPGTTADFQNMMGTLLKSGIAEQSILDGVGEAAANLAVGLKLPYEEAAKMSAKLKEATGVADSEMLAFMDTIARVNQLGVETGEMQFAFSRSAGAMKLLNIQGLDASKSLASVYAQLIKTGASGETVGTGMTSIFNAFLNKDKMAAFNKEAAALGMHFEFIDKATGEFKGVEHMIAQFDQMKGLNTQQRSNLVSALLGPGADAGFMNTLISQGISGFNEMQKKMASQATLNDKVKAQLGTVKNIWEATEGSFTNALANFGAAFADELKWVATLLGKIASGLTEFAAAHPKLMKFIGLFIAISSGVMIFVGVIMIAKAAFALFNAVVLANPIILIIAAIIAAVVLIYVYWDDIAKFFVGLWDRIKKSFFQAWEWIKGLFVKFLEWFKGWGKWVLLPLAPFIAIPLLIVQNWDKIAAFFANLWEVVKGAFMKAWDWYSGLYIKFYDAGKKIITMLWNGIKSMASKPVEAIKDVVKKMRDYLPFSPAKEGPFKDLHKVKIVETIAAAIKPMPAVQAMAGVAKAAYKAFTGKAPGGSGGGASSSTSTASVVINYSPTITIGAGSTPETVQSFEALLKQHAAQIQRIVDEQIARKQRLAF